VASTAVVHLGSGKTVSARFNATRRSGRSRRGPEQARTGAEQEYNDAVKQALRDLGLTYAQLRAQARKGDFQSARARRLWLTIGSPDIA
jgi:hypothetical protein